MAMAQNLTDVTPASVTTVLLLDKTEFPTSPLHSPGILHPFQITVDQRHSLYLKQEETIMTTAYHIKLSFLALLVLNPNRYAFCKQC